MKCRLLLLMIAVSVCQSIRPSVCHTAQLGFTVQKRLNGSRCWLGLTLLGSMKHCVGQGVLISPKRWGGDVGKKFAHCGPTTCRWHRGVMQKCTDWATVPPNLADWPHMGQEFSPSQGMWFLCRLALVGTMWDEILGQVQRVHLCPH